MKNSRGLKGLLASLVSATMLVEIVPSAALAQGNPSLHTDLSPQAGISSQAESDDTSESTPIIVGEDQTKREANVKHFRLSNGSFEAVVFNDTVHYKDENGNFQDIDNTLVRDVRDNGDAYYTNKDNPLEVSLPAYTYQQKAVEVKTKGHRLIWTLQEQRSVPAAVEQPSEIEAVVKEKSQKVFKARKAETPDEKIQRENEGKTVLKNRVSTVSYKDILPGIDVRYDLENSRLKESLILESVPNTDAFTFQIKAENLSATLLENKKVLFCETESGKPVFWIAAPYMFDDDDTYSNDIEVSLRRKDNNWLYIITPNTSWLQTATYPVTIDPTIETSQTNVTAVDVDEGDPNKVNPSTQTMVYVGHPEKYDAQSVAHKYERRAYVNIPMPKLSDSARITQAQLVMTHTPTMSSNASIQVNAHEVTGNWNASTITWNNQPSFKSTITDYYIKSRSSSVGKDYFDITGLAEKWGRGDPNYGVMLEGLETKSTMLDNVGYYSSKTPQVANRPYMTISYREVVGLNSDWTYTTVGNGHEATVSINNNTGNPVVTVPVASSTGNRLPVDLSLLYSYPSTDGDAYGRCGMGASWRTNYHMEVKPVTDANIKTMFPYYMIDENNRKFYFYIVDGKFVDEQGQGYTLTVDNASTSARYKVNSGSKTLTFDSNGLLLKIEDENGNINTLTYTDPPSGGTRVLTSITDGNGKKFNFTYADATYGGLNKITDPNGKIYTFSYTSSQLSKITFPGSRVTNFSYFGAFYTEPLQTITYADGSKVNLTYLRASQSSDFNTSGRQYPVETLSYGNSTSPVEKYAFDYKPSQTDITDMAGNTVTYQFNTNGQVTSMVDQSTGLGQYFEYGSPTDKKSVGDLIGSSPLVSSVNNLLDSPSTDQNTTWSFTGTGIGTISYDSSVGHMSRGSVKYIPSSSNTGTRWANQTITGLSAGMYTASVYITTNGVALTNGTADLYLEALNSSGAVQRTASAVGISATAKNNWQRLTATIEIKSGERLRVNGGTKKARGTFWMDDFQVETGETSSSFNLLENTNYRNGMYSWEASAAPGISTGSVVVTGLPSGIRTISQTVDVSLEAGSTITFGGWSKADSASFEQQGRKYQATYRMGLAFLDSSYNTIGDVSYVNYNEHVSDWQYRLCSAKVPKNAVHVKFLYDYSYNVNKAWFKNGFIYSNGFSETESSDSTIEPSNYLSDTCWNAFQQDENGNETHNETITGKPATSLINNKTYYILNALTGRAIYAGQVSNLSPSYSRPLESENKLYQWKLIQQSAGIYAINLVQPITLSGDSAPSTMTLDLKGGWKDDGTPIQLAKYSATNNNQKFKIVYNDKGSFSLFTYATGYNKCIDGTRATEKPTDKQAAYVRQYSTGSGMTQEDGTVDTKLTDGQKWIFIPYDGSIESNGYIRNQSTYSPEGLKLTATNDRGKTETYTYTSSGKIATKKNANGYTTTYTYDGNTDQLTKMAIGSEYVSYTYDKDRINTIKHNNGKVVYQHQYDTAGRQTSLKVGNGSSFNSLVTNGYNTQNLVTKQTYGTGANVNFGYDSLGRVTGKWYNGNTMSGFSYSYNGNGEPSLQKDMVNNTRTRYTYDSKGNLTNLQTTAGYSLDSGTSLIGMNMKYDDKDRPIENSLYIGGVKKVDSSYRYGLSSNPSENKHTAYGVSYNGSEKLTYTYDAFGRLVNRKLNTTTPFNVSYSYLSGAGTNSTTNTLAGFTAGADAYTYKYDSNGNITRILNGSQTVQYYSYGYDDTLTTEINVNTGNEIYYNYDAGGNLTSKTTMDQSTSQILETVNYTYGNTAWKDQMTSYNGQNITYDAIGNPLTYRDGMTFTWKNGRELATLKKGGVTTSFQYNENSIRTKKTIGSTTTQYYLYGDTVMAEQTGNNQIVYLFDENSNRYGFLYNGTPYYYVYNGQGDVIRLVNAVGTVVSKYEYDTWGKMLAVLNGSGAEQTSSSFIGNINPIRYRGYYYDKDSGLYYLQSRYYDPETCRFLNTDGVMGINGDVTAYNLYAYCGDNPVNRSDNNGMFWEELDEFFKNIIHAGNTILVAIGIDTAAIGAAILNMQMDSYGVYHADFDCWQQYFGYNDLYDIVFSLGTSMKSAKYDFSYGGTKYILWAWKGDYINLGAGAELGIYYGGSGGMWFVDKSLAKNMWLGLWYKNNNIIDYGFVKTWWITGFNPRYQNVSASSLTARFTILFNNKGMFNAFCNRWRDDPSVYVYDWGAIDITI